MVGVIADAARSMLLTSCYLQVATYRLLLSRLLLTSCHLQVVATYKLLLTSVQVYNMQTISTESVNFPAQSVPNR